MANTDAAFGFRPKRKIDGSDWKASEFNVFAPSTYAIDLFIGSPVKFSGDFHLSATDQQSYSGVTLSAANESIEFVVTGFTPDFLNESFSSIFGAASTDRVIQVVPVQGTTFEIQTSGVSATTSSGANANITAEVGNTITGNSTVELDSATIAPTGTHSLMIVGVSGDRARNDLAVDNAVLEVIINKTQLTPGSTGV